LVFCADRDLLLPKTVAVVFALACSAAPDPPKAPEAPVSVRSPSPAAADPTPVSPTNEPAPSAAADRPAPRTGTGFLKGQAHVHSSGSYDAKTPPDRVLAFYAGRGYDFVAITDHNRITVAPPPDGLLLVPGVELTQNAATCTPAPPRGFRCLFHTSGLFVDPARDRGRGELIKLPFHPDRTAAYSAQLAVVAELGGIAMVNHPHFHFAANADMIVTLAEKGLRLLELSNAALDNQSPDGRAAAERRNERLWDDVLSRGARVYGLATDDAHHFPGDGVTRVGNALYSGDRGYVMVRAQKSVQAIREALLAGDFYATTGVAVRELDARREALRIAVEPVAGVSHTVRFVGRGGRVLSESSGSDASYAPRGDEGYVRAVVAASSGEKAWIQPVFIGS
jgi:hypothetical protein